MENELVAALADTLQLLNQGAYTINGKTVELRLSRERMEASHVLLPEKLAEIGRRKLARTGLTESCRVDCVRRDSFAAAVELTRKDSEGAGLSKPVLVLNFANPVNIGGGVYKGARTQEEDLCRRSSLLRSLESSHAFSYYRYNRGLHTHMGSDAILLSPEVEIIKDECLNRMEETCIVAVLTCAAPMISYGTEGLSEEAYRRMFYGRILRVLQCAAYFDYENLVLGAWGCGAFGNDAAVVAELFKDALKDFNWDGLSVRELFRNIVFAVRSRGGVSYNYAQFNERFGSGRF
ncbi:MAG: TIGR02452 family protein [Oscillospiraceae bacterium]|nr:TIGR02452 family protein [Oscillospiraceae bacterium]